MENLNQITLTGLIVAACLLPMAASARLTDTQESVSVSWADLDLSNDTARKTLYRRLESAAEKICGPTRIHLAGSLSQVNRNRQCYETTMSDALETMDMPAIDELHEPR